MMTIAIMMVIASYTDDDDRHCDDNRMVHKWWWLSSWWWSHRTQIMMIAIIIIASYTKDDDRRHESWHDVYRIVHQMMMIIIIMMIASYTDDDDRHHVDDRIVDTSTIYNAANSWRTDGQGDSRRRIEIVQLSCSVKMVSQIWWKLNEFSEIIKQPSWLSPPGALKGWKVVVQTRSMQRFLQ